MHGRAAVVLPDNVLFFDRKPASATPWTKAVWYCDLRTNYPLLRASQICSLP